MKQIIVIDFDGVLHRYGHGDRGDDIYDIPTPGAIEFVITCLKKFDVIVMSSRASTESGRVAIEKWLRHNGFPKLIITNQKPDGDILVFIDDRAIEFRGIFPNVNTIENFTPWWYRHE